MCIPCLIGLFVCFALGLIFLAFKRLRIFGLALICAAIGLASFAAWQVHRYTRDFPLVHVGDSQQRVKGILGRPWRITDGSSDEYGFPRSGSRIAPDVAEEFWYYNMYLPEIWAVSFGGDHKVIRSDHLTSP
jgi:hypothetical protein